MKSRQDAVAVRLGRLLVLALAILTLSTPLALAQSDTTPGWTHPLHARGVQPQRGTFGVFPWESIDMASGAVTLSVTDLVVSGPNGLDIRVRHVINLGDSVTGSVEVGGPVMVLLPGTTVVTGSPNPTVIYDDGSMHYTFDTTGAGSVYRTLGYAQLTKTPTTLETTDGLTYTFGPRGGRTP